ncbi:MAG: alpha/beta hydrolase [Deltaproteobacteria bacterium]|nr:alpha/beta hydrolase [Deltaproteobacteria bacterium]MBW1927959.1 alpha/beta hydrolase [Deltaproteobacteria bacterium]
MALRLALYLLVGYAAVVALAYFFQRQLLYYPDQEKMSEARIRAMGLRYWPSPNNEYKGFISKTTSSTAKGLVIVFHGNAGAAWNRIYYVEALGRLGYRVLLAEYPGYGGRKGKLGEKSFVKDARETVKAAYSEFRGPVYLWGESLGCGVVAAVAAGPPAPISGIIMLTPWDSLPHLAQSIYWYLPVRWLIRDKYDNVANLKSFHGPVAVLVAGQDEIIPKKLGLRLYEALPGPKKLWVFEHSGHNDWPTAPNETWWRKVMEFVSEGHDL